MHTDTRAGHEAYIPAILPLSVTSLSREPHHARLRENNDPQKMISTKNNQQKNYLNKK
jgi:hypothetical protein